MIARPADFCEHQVVTLTKKAGEPLRMTCSICKVEGLTAADLPLLASLASKLGVEQLDEELERRRL